MREQLWEAQEELFFKPAGGHGSKAVYRGDKLTKGVWAEIARGDYVAQDFAAPSERMIRLDGSSGDRARPTSGSMSMMARSCSRRPASTRARRRISGRLAAGLRQCSQSEIRLIEA